MAITRPRGTEDIIGTESKKWQYIEAVIRNVCDKYNYNEIRTPIFEKTDLFVRGVGETTDIVSKEMYTFNDKKGRSMTLRPEGTAGVMRSFIEHKMYGDASLPKKMFYIGPMFRYERPQAGRQRQFTQFGIEATGSHDPIMDAEIIALTVNIYKILGFRNLKVLLNTLGDEESRTNYRQALVDHFSQYTDQLCNDCKTRLEKNPLRVLDCKVDADKEFMATAPTMKDYMNDISKNHFEQVINYLDALEIEYILDDNLVRGLDYYTHTVFEITAESSALGSQTALGGGGRYNNLVKELGGPDVPSVGFAMGMERVLMVLNEEGVFDNLDDSIDFYLLTMGDKAKLEGLCLLDSLRLSGFICETDYLNKSMKAQFKQSDRFKAKYIGIIGDNEVDNNTIEIKNTETNEKVSIALTEVMEYLDINLDGE